MVRVRVRVTVTVTSGSQGPGFRRRGPRTRRLALPELHGFCRERKKLEGPLALAASLPPDSDSCPSSDSGCGDPIALGCFPPEPQAKAFMRLHGTAQHRGILAGPAILKLYCECLGTTWTGNSTRDPVVFFEQQTWQIPANGSACQQNLTRAQPKLTHSLNRTAQLAAIQTDHPG